MSPSFYFAYGSNMSPTSMTSTTPGAVDRGAAVLRDHRLRFSRRSVRWSAGVADVVPAPDLVTWGRLYAIPPGVDLAALDKREGVQTGAYRRKEVEVKQGSIVIPAFIYSVVEKEDAEVAPSLAYMKSMIDGATDATVGALPGRYVEFLEYILTNAGNAHSLGSQFRGGTILLPTTSRTGRGTGPLLLSSSLGDVGLRRRGLATVEIGAKRILVRVAYGREVPEGTARLDQVARAHLTNRHVEAFGHDAEIELVTGRAPVLISQPRTTVLRVSRPAVADAEKEVAVIHSKPLELLGLQPGDHVRVRAVRVDAGGKRRLTSLALRAYSGSEVDLSHAGRPDYPRDNEICLDQEARERLGVTVRDSVWVSASAQHELRGRFVYYAITAFLGVATISPVLQGFNVPDVPAFVISIALTTFITIAVAVVELRRKIGA